MYAALNESIVPKKTARQPTATVSTPQDCQTINMNDLNTIKFPKNVNENTNNNNSNDSLPVNFQLVPFDTDDDDVLMKYLEQNEDELNKIPRQNTQTTMSNTVMSTSMPVIPRMYFPHSNVTINYNFAK